MRRGFLGGTFDPIHSGHLDVAAAAQRALELDLIEFLPAGTCLLYTSPSPRDA